MQLKTFTTFLLALSFIQLTAQFDLVNESYSDLDTLDTVQTLSAGQSTHDMSGGVYYNITNAGILAINDETGAVLNSFPDTLHVKGIEYDVLTKKLYCSYWSATNNAEIFVAMDTNTGAFTTIATLQGPTLFFAGESTFDSANGRYFNASPGYINVIDIASGAILAEIPTTNQIKGMEYDELEDRLIGSYWNGAEEIFTSVNLTDYTITDLGTLVGVQYLSLGESAFDAANRFYFNKTNLGITMIDADLGTIINSFPVNNGFKHIEVAARMPQGALPVELVDFSAKVNNDQQVVLEWGTATELNNDYFMVERSVNTTNWENIGRVNGKGNSNALQQYQYIDQNPILGQSYYRLRQKDLDGKEEIFAPKVVKVRSSDTSVTLFPNPASQELNIVFENQNETVLQVFNQFGQSVTAQVNSKSDGNLSSLDISRLSPGVYTLLIGTVGKQFTKL